MNGNTKHTAPTQFLLPPRRSRWAHATPNLKIWGLSGPRGLVLVQKIERTKGLTGPSPAASYSHCRCTCTRTHTRSLFCGDTARATIAPMILWSTHGPPKPHTHARTRVRTHMHTHARTHTIARGISIRYCSTNPFLHFVNLQRRGAPHALLLRSLALCGMMGA